MSPLFANVIQHVLITKNKTSNTKPSVAARTKDMRLKGSNLYVARRFVPKRRPKSAGNRAMKSDPVALPSYITSIASLYDKLSPLSRAPSLSHQSDTGAPESSMPHVRESRPCCWCVTAMYSAGMKRVFWTNHDGKWEGAKM